jgi:hypothetical protein
MRCMRDNTPRSFNREVDRQLNGPSSRQRPVDRYNPKQTDPLAALGLEQRSLGLLKELHILTREGTLNHDSRRKLKQVQHLIQFITPLLEACATPERGPTLVDHGAGKSYLGFMLWDAWFARRAMPQGEVLGIEIRDELVSKSHALAQKLGFKGMRFLALNTQDALIHTKIPQQIDIVTALHACDTATDDAIRFGLERGAQHIVAVPCCQAEVAAKLRANKALSMQQTPLAELWRHPHHTREFGAQMTNVLRCLQLEAHGYQVTVTELVGWEHSMKNELILASRHADVPRQRAARRLAEVLDQTGLRAELGTRFFVPTPTGAVES